MLVKTLSIQKINPAPYNPRKITDEAMQRLERSITEFDLVEPLVVNRQTGYTLVSGHQRLKVLEKQGKTEVECVLVDLSASREKALNIALNNPAMAGEYDFSKLADLLAEIDTGEFDVSALTGFDPAELERIANWTPGNDAGETQAIPEPPAAAISQTGDLWELGKHRLLCGDSTEAADIDLVMKDEKASLCMTSPPYWVGKEYEREHSWEEVQKFIVASVKQVTRVVDRRIVINTGAPAAAHLTGERAHVRLLLDDWQRHFHSHGWLLRYVRIWSKRGGLAHIAPSSDCIDQHWEFIAVFYDPLRYEGQRRCGEKWATDGIWDDIVGTMSEAGHVASFPVEIPSRNIMLYTDRGNLVYEPFCGAGTTIIAAEKLGRRCYAMEIEPRYVDVSVKRWQNFTKKQARNLTRPEVVIA